MFTLSALIAVKERPYGSRIIAVQTDYLKAMQCTFYLPILVSDKYTDSNDGCEDAKLRIGPLSVILRNALKYVTAFLYMRRANNDPSDLTENLIGITNEIRTISL